MATGTERRCARHARPFFNECFECSMEKRLEDLHGKPVRIESVRYPPSPSRK